MSDPDTNRRLLDLENFRFRTEAALVREDENRKHMDYRFNQIDQKMQTISEGIKKIPLMEDTMNKVNKYTGLAVWLVAGSIIVALIKFVVTGEINV